MKTLNHSFLKNISVEIGDLRVDFLNPASLLSPQEAKASPLHLHAKHEFQYIISGSFETVIDEDAQLKVDSGSALLLPPNILHRNDKGSWRRVTLIIAMQQIGANTNETGFSEFRYYCELLGKLQTPMVITDTTISYCMEQLLSISDAPCNIHKQKCLLSLLFIRLASCVKSDCQVNTEGAIHQNGSQRNYQYYLIEQFINTHYNKKTAIAELAEILHVSQRQTDRIVLEIFGKTYAILVLERRMSVAQTMLKKTDIPCAVIAESVGYSSYAGFFIAFKQYFNMTPDEMRDANKRQ